MKRYIPIRLAALALAIEGVGGCATTRREPEIKTVEVKIPVPVPCKAEVTLRQSYTDATAEFLSDIRDQVAALLAGRAERQADAARLKGAVVGCGGTVK